MPIDRDTLLQSELDQRHQYARHAYDRFIQYAVLLCTLNGIAAGWLTERIEFQLDLFADIVFILVNSNAVYVSSMMLKQIRETGVRINEILKLLQLTSSEKDIPVQSAFNEQWQLFTVKQFRIAFCVLVICWILSIFEAFCFAEG